MRLDRAQAHMLEAVVASILLLTSIVFALQMTAVTPLSASTSNQHIENQQRASAEGVLASAAETGALERAVLYWNQSEEAFHNATEVGYYATNPPPNEFGTMLERTFGERGIAYNVYVVYRTPSGNEQRKRMVYRGAPSDNAVSATRTVTLVDDDPIYFMNETVSDETIGNTTQYYANDVTSGALYNVVRVEVVVWRV